MKRYPVVIKGINKLSISERKIFSDLIRSVIYRFSGKARRGIRGLTDELLTNPFGFTLYADTSEVRDLYFSLLFKFSSGYPKVTIRKRIAQSNRENRDLYRLVQCG